MGVVQVHLPDHIKESIDGQVTAGRVTSETEFLVEARSSPKPLPA